MAAYDRRAYPGNRVKHFQSHQSEFEPGVTLSRLCEDLFVGKMMGCVQDMMQKHEAKLRVRTAPRLGKLVVGFRALYLHSKQGSVRTPIQGALSVCIVFCVLDMRFTLAVEYHTTTPYSRDTLARAR